MTKAELHATLDALIIGDTDRRVNALIIGHALIELELLTSIECAWEHCILPAREFIPYRPKGAGANKARDKGVISIDHVVSRSDGGSEMPNNIQFLHLACNAAKGSRDAKKNPDVVARHSEGMKRMWADPAKRAERVAIVALSQRRPDVAARKSEAMKAYWADKKAKDSK